MPLIANNIIILSKKSSEPSINQVLNHESGTENINKVKNENKKPLFKTSEFLLNMMGIRKN